MFNTFLPKPGYAREDGARELGEQFYTSIFTRDEMATAASGLGLAAGRGRLGLRIREGQSARRRMAAHQLVRRLGDGSRRIRPAAEENPIELRWLVYQKG